jgi:hypothetical protein
MNDAYPPIRLLPFNAARREAANDSHTPEAASTLHGWLRKRTAMLRGFPASPLGIGQQDALHASRPYVHLLTLKIKGADMSAGKPLWEA